MVAPAVQQHNRENVILDRVRTGLNCKRPQRLGMFYFNHLFIYLYYGWRTPTWSAGEEGNGHKDEDHAAVWHPRDLILRGQTCHV